MFQVNETLAGVWGLDASREYTQVEIDASEHLQWAHRAGALVNPQGADSSPRGETFEIDGEHSSQRDGVDENEASHAGKTLSRRARERREN